MLRWYVLFVIIICGNLTPPTRSVAAMTRYRVRGTVTEVFALTDSPFKVSQSFTAEFSIVQTVNDAFPDDPTTGFYLGAVPSYSIDVGGGAYAFSDASGGLVVRNDYSNPGPPIDYLEVFAREPAFAPQVGGEDLFILQMSRLDDETATIFADDAIPPVIPALENFDVSAFSLQFEASDPLGAGTQVIGLINSIVIVPEPSAPLQNVGLGLGLLGMGLLSRRSRNAGTAPIYATAFPASISPPPIARGHHLTPTPNPALASVVRPH